MGDHLTLPHERYDIETVPGPKTLHENENQNTNELSNPNDTELKVKLSN